MHRLSLKCAPLLMLLSACSLVQSRPQMQRLEASLSRPCPNLPAPPRPLIGEARDQWEREMIAAYGKCANRHWWTVEAWNAAMKGKK